MSICVNGKTKEIETPQSLQNFIKKCVDNPDHLVCEVNGEIVKRPNWAVTTINDGDSLEIVRLVAGG